MASGLFLWGLKQAFQWTRSNQVVKRRPVWNRNRMAITREGIAYIAIMSVMFLGAIIGRTNMLMFVFAMMIGPWVLNGWIAFSMLRRMHAKRTLPHRVMAGETVSIEIEAANLRLIKVMADRLAHEVGNALVPLSTHQQLLGEKFKDPEFRASLDLAMSDGVKRVSRLINQMRYLARDAVLMKEAVSLTQLIDEAYKEAYKYQPTKSAKLYFDDGKHPIIIVGDRAALRHAFAEVILNAIQANPTDAKVQIQAQTETGQAGLGWIHIEIVDNGTGFAADAAQKVPAPFFTTRTVGLGLGLCVTKKIVEVHQGRLTIVGPVPNAPGTVRISLPLNLAANVTK